jgi:hypothetical protein
MLSKRDVATPCAKKHIMFVLQFTKISTLCDTITVLNLRKAVAISNIILPYTTMLYQN